MDQDGVSDSESVITSITTRSTSTHSFKYKGENRINSKKLSPYQRRIHFSRGERFKMSFKPAKTGIAYSESYPKLMESTETGDTITFRVDSDAHYLRYTKCIQEFRSIKVKEEFKGKYEICYPSMPGHNIFTHAEMNLDGTRFELTPFCLDSYFEHYVVSKEQYQREAGHISHLIEWSDFLPSWKTSVVHPWPMSFGPNKAIPCFLIFGKRNQKQITFSYKLRSAVKDFIRMRVKSEDGSYTIIPFDETKVEEVSKDERFKPMKMYGYYSSITSAEMKSIVDHQNDLPYTISYDHFVVQDVDTTLTHASSYTIEPTCFKPCKGLFFAAENQDGSLSNNFSNYTTHPDEKDAGFDPINYVSINCGLTKLNKVPPELFTSGHTEASSKPRSLGIHFHPTCNRTFDDETDVGIVWPNHKGKLTISINEEGPYGRITECKYRPQICLIANTQITFYLGSVDEDEHEAISDGEG